MLIFRVAIMALESGDSLSYIDEDYDQENGIFKIK
jgi:hypothetical protein